MSISLRNLLGLAFLAAVAVGTAYWSRLEGIGFIEEDGRRQVPLGYYVTDAVLLATDETGEVRYRIAAREAEELPDESRLVMSQVLIDYQPAAHVPWRISATTAEGPVNRSYLELTGEVTIRSEPSDGAQPVLVRTTRLNLDPNTYVVTTDAEVHVQIGTQRLRGTGLVADLMGDRLELESNVHGQILR